ncbi:MAG: GntR family transcriptional regulator [Planctomycetota bacterium]
MTQNQTDGETRQRLSAREVRDQIIEQVRVDVITGVLPESMSLREQALASKYGVSRAPVRDALLELTREGVLVAKPNHGVKVSRPSSPELQKVVVGMRRKIEVFALKKAFESRDRSWVDRVEATLERLRTPCEENATADIVRCDLALHRSIVEAPEIEGLVSIWVPVTTRMFMRYSRLSGGDAIFREHAAIVDAIRDQDFEAAKNALVANVR